MSTEPVGSVTEEAAKLLAVLQGWAGDHASDRDGAGAGGAGRTSGGPSPYDSETSAKDTHPHTSHDPAGSECRWCPLCQLVRTAKATSPEVREHLTNAAASFALAVQELFATPPQQHEPAEGTDPTERDVPIEKIEKIDLVED